MITSAFLYLTALIISTLLLVFPASEGLPTEFSTALTTLSGYVGILDPIVPISTLASALGIILLFEATIFAFRGISWVYQRIPFLGK